MAACNASYDGMPRIPLSCEELPDSDDPSVCRQNPYKRKLLMCVSESIYIRCTNYDAESIAIRAPIELLHQQFDRLEQKLCGLIFSCVLSVLEALTNTPYDGK